MVDGQRCILVLPVYVDDLLPMGDKVLTDEFESYIGNYYQVSILRDTNHFLGIRIERNRESCTLSLDQVKYVDRIMSAIAGDNLPDFPTPMSNQVLSRRIVYSIYYNSTLLLPVRGEGEGC